MPLKKEKIFFSKISLLSFLLTQPFFFFPFLFSCLSVCLSGHRHLSLAQKQPASEQASQQGGRFKSHSLSLSLSPLLEYEMSFSPFSPKISNLYKVVLDFLFLSFLQALSNKDTHTYTQGTEREREE